MKCTVIWRSWVWTLVKPNFGCVVHLSSEPKIISIFHLYVFNLLSIQIQWRSVIQDISSSQIETSFWRESSRHVKQVCRQLLFCFDTLFCSTSYPCRLDKQRLRLSDIYCIWHFRTWCVLGVYSKPYETVLNINAENSTFEILLDSHPQLAEHLTVHVIKRRGNKRRRLLW